MDPTSLGIVTTIAIAIVASIWRLSAMRTDLHERWKTKVQLTTAGLNSNANATLIKLRGKIDEVTALDGGVVGEFHPHKITANPDDLKTTVNTYLGYISKRDKANFYYRGLLALPKIIIFILSVSLIILLAFVVKQFQLHPILDVVSLNVFKWAAVLLGLVTIVLFLMFIGCQQSLTSAQIASDDEC